MLPSDRKKSRAERGTREVRFKKKKGGGAKKEWWSTRHMLVSSSYGKWSMGSFFVLNCITPLLPSLLCQFLHHPRTQSSFSMKGHLVLLNFQLSTGLGRDLFLNKTVKQHIAHWMYRKQPSVPHQPLSCTGHCTTGMSTCAWRRRGMFTFPLCLKHMNWVGMLELLGGWQKKEGEGKEMRRQ